MQSLSSDGERVEDGSFTMDLTLARQKLARYQGSISERSLVFLVSALVSAGAQQIEISSSPSEIVLTAPGAFVDRASFVDEKQRLILGGYQTGRLDLLLGCQHAILRGANQVEIQAHSDDAPGYRWTLHLDRDLFSELESSPESSTRITISVAKSRWFATTGSSSVGGGYAGMPAEYRQVDRACAHSLVPISIEGKSINRPFFLTQVPLAIQVGELPPRAVSFPRAERKKLEPGQGGWRGAFGLQPGKVTLIVSGVEMGTLRRTGLDGVVFHDGLKRDLSRESLVEDRQYDELWRDLRRLALDAC